VDRFGQFYYNAERLVRRRRAWRWGGQGAVAGLTLTLLYLVAAIPGWVPAPGLLWLLAFNALVAAGAAWGGQRAPVDMDGVLFQIDQILKTGELLLTLGDLKERGETEFSVVRFHGDDERAAAVYEGVRPLTGRDVAETILWIAERPAHVNVAEVVLLPTDQASPTLVHRRSG